MERNREESSMAGGSQEQTWDDGEEIEEHLSEGLRGPAEEEKRPTA